MLHTTCMLNIKEHKNTHKYNEATSLFSPLKTTTTTSKNVHILKL